MLRERSSGGCRPALARGLRCPVDRRGNVGSRLAGSQSQVLRLGFLTLDEGGQPQVHLASPAYGRQRGGRLGEEGMCEPQFVPAGDEDTGGHGLFRPALSAARSTTAPVGSP